MHALPCHVLLQERAEEADRAAASQPSTPSSAKLQATYRVGWKGGRPHILMCVRL